MTDFSNIPCVYGPSPMRPSYDGPWFPTDAMSPEKILKPRLDLDELPAPDAELVALIRCVNELSKLDDPTRKRIVHYLTERFGI